MQPANVRSRFLAIMTVVETVGDPTPAMRQSVKSTVSRSPLQASTLSEWVRDLQYRSDQLYPLFLGSTGCPLVQVDVAGTAVSLLFDTGAARGFLLTNHAPRVPYAVRGRSEELNADGSHRGESLDIQVDSISVLGEAFHRVSGSVSDWQLFSSEPFDGAVGLDFFRTRRVTLDYTAGKIGVTALPIQKSLDARRYVALTLVEPPESQGKVLYARARVNGLDAIVYFDTGTNVSFIDPAFAVGLARVQRPGRFPMFREHVPVEFAGRAFTFEDLRETPIRRGTNFDAPVALVLGSDILSQFIVTIDLRANKLVLGGHRERASPVE